MYQRKKLIPKKYDKLIKYRHSPAASYEARGPEERRLWCEMMWEIGGFSPPKSRLTSASNRRVSIPRPAETDPKPW